MLLRFYNFHSMLKKAIASVILVWLCFLSYAPVFQIEYGTANYRGDFPPESSLLPPHQNNTFHVFVGKTTWKNAETPACLAPAVAEFVASGPVGSGFSSEVFRIGLPPCVAVAKVGKIKCEQAGLTKNDCATLSVIHGKCRESRWNCTHMFPVPYYYSDLDNTGISAVNGSNLSQATLLEGVCIMEEKDCPTFQDRSAFLEAIQPDNFMEFLKALEVLERAGIEHRDLHARHLLLCKTGPAILDFGWSNIGFPSGTNLPPLLGRHQLSEDQEEHYFSNPHAPNFSNLNSFGLAVMEMLHHHNIQPDPWLAEIVVAMTDTIPSRWPSIDQARSMVKKSADEHWRTLGLGISWDGMHKEFLHDLKSIDVDIVDLILFPAFSSDQEKVGRMTAFYEQSLAQPDVSIKVVDDERGTVPFLVAILAFQPEYHVVQTTHGLGVAYDNLFNLKRKIRKEKRRVHFTDNDSEFDHNIHTLGLSKWMNVRHIPQRPSFSSFPDLFDKLGSTCEYVFLRNFEEMPEGPDPIHGDLDILVHNYTACSAVMGALPKLNVDQMHTFGGFRVQNTIRVNRTEIQADLRWLGDGYMDSKWENDMLREKVLFRDHFWIPSPEHTFFGLLYHALVQKRVVAKDYEPKLARLADAVAGVIGDCKWSCVRPKIYASLETLEEKRDFLCKYMKLKGYQPVPPNDKSVYYHQWIESCKYYGSPYN